MQCRSNIQAMPDGAILLRVAVTFHTKQFGPGQTSNFSCAEQPKVNVCFGA